MKNNLLYMFIFFGLIFASCEKEDLAITKVMNLESKLTQPETEWTGDKTGIELPGDWGSTWKNQFSDDNNLFVFDNYFSDFSWGGFMYTNKSDIINSNYTNNSAITGKANSGKVYLTANNTSENPAVISFKDGTGYRVSGIYITNSTYAYLSMKNGDQFSKKFSNGDWFKLDIFGKDISGNNSSTVTVYLADFRNGKTELLDNWTWVELSGLGVLKSLHFNLSSSDTSDWGMNTPSYFCVDDITILIE